MTKENFTLPEGTKIPKHIAIIPDGNRRWAKQKGLPVIEGHRKGSQIIPTIIRAARKFGVHTLTLWAFSTENWSRAENEVKPLLKLFEIFLDGHIKELIKEKIRFIHLGRKDRLPESLRKKLADAEEKTKNNTVNILNVALDYGGHDEIIRATKKIITDVKSGKIKPDDLDKEIGKYGTDYPFLLYKNYLDTKDQPYPYPDLLIRTSGEQRTSGFLPWQLAYAEFYREKDHFPDFSVEKLKQAIIDFSNRKRRFGS